MLRISKGGICVLVILVFSAVGCGDVGYEKMSTVSDVAEFEQVQSSGEPSVTLTAAQDAKAASVTVVNLQRKIIYNTTIGLVVDDYQTFETDLPTLVNANGGFVARNQTNRQYQDSQSGTWVIRIPVAKYTAFLNGVSSLGFAESRSEEAQDVTEEYVDVEARIKNKKSLETRIISILKERDGKLSEVLEIERELSRVREEIERMEGRLRFLKERTSLATVTISCREQKEYQPLAAPSLTARIGTAWSDSTGAMQSLAESALICLIAFLPWTALLSLILFVAYRTIRSRFRGYLTGTTDISM